MNELQLMEVPFSQMGYASNPFIPRGCDPLLVDLERLYRYRIWKRTKKGQVERVNNKQDAFLEKTELAHMGIIQ